jgi:fructokinase
MDIVCLGELLIDFFPSEVGRSLEKVSSFRPVPGGAPANVAVAAARLNRRSAFIGKVGQDDFGALLASVLAGEGVETAGLRFDPQVRTTINFLSQPDVNSYTCLFFRNPGADTCLRPDELDRDLISSAKAFHFGSLSLTDEPARSATSAAVQIAKMGGGLVSFDVNYRPTLWKNPSEARDVVMTILPEADLLKVNEGELRLLTGSNELASARQLVNLGPRFVMVTLGPQGCYFQTDQGGELVPAFDVATVDATGCGDAFVAGLLSRLVSEGDWRGLQSMARLRDMVRYANAVGALTALTQGVIPALPSAEQVEAFLGGFNE